jgi:hypothetical protein
MTRGLGAANCEDQATVWRLLSARLLTMRGVFALPNNAEQARETSGRPEKAPARLTADRRASTNPICSDELGEFVTSVVRAISHNHRHSERENQSVANQQAVLSNRCAVISQERSIFPFRSESRSARASITRCLAPVIEHPRH